MNDNSAAEIRRLKREVQTLSELCAAQVSKIRKQQATIDRLTSKLESCQATVDRLVTGEYIG